MESNKNWWKENEIEVKKKREIKESKDINESKIIIKKD